MSKTERRLEKIAAHEEAIAEFRAYLRLWPNGQGHEVCTCTGQPPVPEQVYWADCLAWNLRRVAKLRELVAKG